jgi:hypothetical protein
MDSVSGNVVEALVNAESRLRLSSNQFDGFEEGPRTVTLRQAVHAITFGDGKNATYSSE